MNRRDFLKASILLPSLSSLIPTCDVEQPEPPAKLIDQPCRIEGGGIVVINGWCCNYSPLEDWETDVLYEGTVSRIIDLRKLIESAVGSNLKSINYQTKIDDMVNEVGEVVGYIARDWSNLNLTLRGRWRVKIGIVPERTTGIRKEYHL